MHDEDARTAQPNKDSINKMIAAFVATMFASAAFAQTPAATTTTTPRAPLIKVEVKADKEGEKAKVKTEEKITKAKADAKVDAQAEKAHAKAHAKVKKN